MYGNSGEIWGVVIGIIIGAIIVFLICRELICWYYKINKIVDLMEKQNKIFLFFLKSQNIDIPAELEQTNDANQNIPKIEPNALYNKKCKNCGELVFTSLKKCTKCDGTEFI